MKKPLESKLWKSSNAFDRFFTKEEGLPVLTDGAAAAGSIIILVLFLIVSAWA